jgi:hypothetical protein
MVPIRMYGSAKTDTVLNGINVISALIVGSGGDVGIEAFRLPLPIS